ncbi:hypothetical protein [Lactococcus lactis]|uniref:hypothetical protein n=1 Tax=Lactococcus lactis TaxID=1358 RepID=UPI0019140409|nr:hypothetical protein [Lactococcus lactis]WDA67447.1 hypothetical protein IL310_01390 [Lactococcus lactis]WDA67482.1 hypothetical protein IL310_00985 [Lactococcus lactis]
MTDKIQTLGTWALGLVLIGGGFWAMIWGVIDIAGAAGGKTKEWGKALIGLGVGVLGGFLIFIGATTLINWFKQGGSEIPFK